MKVVIEFDEITKRGSVSGLGSEQPVSLLSFGVDIKRPPQRDYDAEVGGDYVHHKPGDIIHFDIRGSADARHTATRDDFANILHPLRSMLHKVVADAVWEQVGSVTIHPPEPDPNPDAPATRGLYVDGVLSLDAIVDAVLEQFQIMERSAG